MVCIYCSSETKVTNSRHQKRTNTVWRRRQCLSCSAVFSTIETPDTSLTLTVRNNKQLQPFQRDKLFLSVFESLKHRKTAQTDATSLTNTMLATIYQLSEDSVIDQDVIVTVCGTVLERFDKIAATHYKAFHPLAA